MKKKTLTALALVTLTGVTLVGCGKNENTVTDDSTSTDHSNKTNTTEEKKAKTAEKIVKQYTEAIFAGNYDEALSMIDMPEGSIKDASAYENYLLKSDLAPADIKSIETTEMSSGEERQVDVSIETKDGDYIETTFYACLTDDNKWMISPKELVVENWKVVVPSGATVKLNGEELSVKPKQEENVISDVNEQVVDIYTIPMIISANYQLEVSHPLAVTSNEEKVFPGSTKTVELVVTDEKKEEVYTALTNLFTTIISNAVEGNDFGVLVDDVIASNSPSLPAIQESYNMVKERLTGQYKFGTLTYEYKDTTASDIKIQKINYNGNNTVYIEGTYTSVYNERYNSQPFSLESIDNEFQALLEVSKDGKYLLIESRNIFNLVR